uniref:Retrovirus-related Pol polyprotein from transposon TNT 1-94 n=1 Tax=Cajanus cajan TaxID=3821 RepID=A0A151QQG1_CAJCA|nr:Retrovirus-related Pol polyprotein from transposon TNT 1-94 [Cajanus cajan]
MCVRCPIEVSGRRFRVNLIVLPMVDINIILGMDWLSAHHIFIDCARRELVFPQLEDEVLVSAGRAEQLMRDGAECFMLFATLSFETERAIAGIEIVSEFPKVFLDDVEDYSIKLNKSLYGLKQSGRMWYNRLSEYLLQERYKNDPICPCIFIKRSENGFVIIVVHVDDINIIGTPEELSKAIDCSNMWEHFTKQKPYSEKKAKCNYCGDLIKYLAGISGMRNHLMRCKENPNREVFKRQKLSSSTIEGVSVGPSPTISKFDQNASRMKLVKMFVKSELPFRFVEDDDFRDFVWSLQPRFEVPSCMMRFHLEILKNSLSGSSQGGGCDLVGAPEDCYGD